MNRKKQIKSRRFTVLLKKHTFTSDIAGAIEKIIE
jgi:hypothetical protein